MKLLPGLLLTVVLLIPAAGAGPVHGPICSWHLDPTSTMTIQWIERVNVPVQRDQWFESAAGFGYGDHDDLTVVEMQDVFPRLYVRKEFEIKDLPTVAGFDASGTWKVATKVDKTDVNLVIDLKSEGEGGKLTGTVLQEAGTPIKITNGYVSGKTIYVEFQVLIGLLPVKVEVSGTQDDKDPHKLAGNWVGRDQEGKELAKGDVTAVRDVPEGEKAETSEEDAKDDDKKEAEKVVNPEAYELILKIRYDDAFIAYLNGEEILRKGVKSGRGASAEGIESHEADPEKEDRFTIDKTFNRFLKEGINIIALEGHNAQIDSSDFTLDPEFSVKIGNDEKQVVDDNATWQFYLGDPGSGWHTEVASGLSRPPMMGDLVEPYELRYAERGKETSKRVTAEVLEFAHTRQPLHRVVLRGLEPDTAYGFTIHEGGGSERLKNRKWFFKTAPATRDRPLTFVTGGDMYHKRDLLDAMNGRCAQTNPLFALLGGDLAYANGKDADRWYDWVDSWHQWCETVDDYLIPMVVAIGNHECSQNIDGVKEEDRDKFKPAENAKFFYSLFPLPEGVSNYAMDFGDYMSILILDSNHTQTPKAQAPWLESALQRRQGVPNLFVCYHRPTYGALVKGDEPEVRKHWTPLFEKYGVDAAFENDHHIYKRTHPIVDGAVDPGGVLYMGDGSWGVDVRDIPWDKVRQLDYIATAAKVNHLIQVSLLDGWQRFDALDAAGRKVDSHIRFTR